MRVIIAGGRDFNDYELLKDKVDYILRNRQDEDIEIVSGKARGADSLGEKYAKEKGYQIKEFPADWDTYKKRAGYIRNEEMANYASHCICFWDGQSRGTKHMIDIAKREKLNIRVIRY
jgi:hypothetical protein